MNLMTYCYIATLFITGILSYFVWSHQESMTALIPSFFAIFLLLYSSFAPSRFQLGGLIVIAILLLLGTLPGVFKLGMLIRGEMVARPLAVKVQSFTALINLIYLIISSFKLLKK